MIAPIHASTVHGSSTSERERRRPYVNSDEKDSGCHCRRDDRHAERPGEEPDVTSPARGRNAPGAVQVESARSGQEEQSADGSGTSADDLGGVGVTRHRPEQRPKGGRPDDARRERVRAAVERHADVRAKPLLPGLHGPHVSARRAAEMSKGNTPQTGVSACLWRSGAYRPACVPAFGEADESYAASHELRSRSRRRPRSSRSSR